MKTKTKRKPMVYIAHPINLGDMFANCRTAILTFRRLVLGGYHPFCPGAVDVAVRLATDGLDYERWMEYDYGWLAVCDALLRLPGTSRGATREVRFANKRGIPVFYTWTALEKWRKEVFLTGRKSTKKKATRSSPSKPVGRSQSSSGKSTRKKGRR